jgi:hypothetical protein
VPTKSAQYFASHPAALLPHRNPAAERALNPLLDEIAAAHMRWKTTLSCRPGHRRTSPLPRFSQSFAASANWSGYQASSDPDYQGAGPGSFLGAFMKFTVPNVSAPDASTPVSSSIWPGIGTGSSTADTLIQAGSEQDVQCSAASCSPVYYFWYELFPQESQQLINLTASPGDQVGAFVEYDPSSQQAEFGVTDFTTNIGTSLYQTVSGVGPGEGSTAEFIVERTQENGVLPELANFGTVATTYASAAYGTSLSDPSLDFERPLGNLSPQSITMTTCNGATLLAQPGPIGGDNVSFNDTWQNYGTVDPPTC